MRRFILVAIASLALAAFAAGPASAARNPNPTGSGQPSQECGATGAESAPPGFSTGGFANAEGQYADGGANDNPHAISQYDVACFQVTSSGH
jgi:hypothetical protein